MLKLITCTTVITTMVLIMAHTTATKDAGTYRLASNAPFGLFNKLTNDSTCSAKDVNAECYNLWQIGNAGLCENAFDYALKGLSYLKKSDLIRKKDIITIIDFSKPSTEKRLFVIDLFNGKILYRTWVAHGRNSGNEYANEFSNSPESHQSSLGFYTTMDSYIGCHGYSLRIKGCEAGINDKAYERAIVIHGADYVSNDFINTRGSLGRSYGCPAIPIQLSKEIINVIKNGSCLFIYHPTKKYCSKSKILNNQT